MRYSFAICVKFLLLGIFLLITSGIRSQEKIKSEQVNLTTFDLRSVEMPDTVAFGGCEIIADESGENYLSYDLNLEFVNNDTVPFIIKRARMSNGKVSIMQYMMYETEEGLKWTPINEIYFSNNLPAPEFTILPGEKLSTIIRFTPVNPGKVTDKVILTTNVGQKQVVITGIGYEPPILNIDESPVEVQMDTVFEDERFIYFDNAGGWFLNYDISVIYKRSINTNLKYPDQIKTGNFVEKGISPLLSESQIRSSETDSSNRVMQHISEAGLSYAYGTDELVELTLATKYNSGPDGFNVSSVGTWFIGEKLQNGNINVEVRAGGSSVEDAVPLATGSLAYELGLNEENGKMYDIPLDKEATIYPNEDFYVLITYPAEIERPQGCVKNKSVERVEGQYLVYWGTQWYDIQTFDAYSDCAWIMYAAETEPKDNTWVKVDSITPAILEAGDTARIVLKFDGTIAMGGDQNADIIFKSDDRNRPEVRIPVKLHINEAPYFVNPPSDIYMIENTTEIVEIDLVDKEGDEFEIIPVTGAKIVTYDLRDSKLILTISPRLGDVGTFTVIYRVADQFGLSQEMTLNIHVKAIEVNLPPVYIGKTTPFVYSFMEKSIEYNINDMFEDPDGDEITFTVSSENNEVAGVVQFGDSIFVVKPYAVGNTRLNFVVSDKRDGVIQHSIDIEIGICLDPSGIVVQKWNDVLLVNNFGDKYNADGYQWYRNDEPIKGATGQYYSVGNKETDILDFSSIYYVRLVTAEGDTLYTCPITPVPQSQTFKAYPNPVNKGGVLTIESSDQDNEPTVIRIVNLKGQVLRSFTSTERTISIQMPSEQGFYLVKVTSGSFEKTFNVNVE